MKNEIILLGNLYGDKNPQAGRIYSAEGISPSLDTCQGGNRMPKIVDEPKVIKVGNYSKDKTSEGGVLLDTDGIFSTITAGTHGYGMANIVEARACLTPDRINKRQNGRRFKEDDEPMFTLTSQDRQGVMMTDDKAEVKIRKLTPKECFRLMGFDDEDCDKCAEAGISNTQLYKMAGNSIVVNVLQAIFDELDNFSEK